jgi:7,8-dihydropterin-6-yl-methyl-4-(beta-D-ribofuranosyl)aminobenzene 5'-phosphate synthase
MKAQTVDIERLKITIIYDNHAFNRQLRTDHGFSCIMEGPEETILFDTGGSGTIFMDNLRKMKIFPDQVDAVFISHSHYDHSGGLPRFLETNPKVSIYIPRSASAAYKAISGQFGSKIIPVDEPQPVSHQAMSTGEMKSSIIGEQSLMIPTTNGTVVITGCAHPGIGTIIDRAEALTHQKVFMVIGGFHLMSDTQESIRKTISRLQSMGVRYVAPSHCTGKEAIQMFADAYGNAFIQSGVGRIVRGSELSE